MLGHLLLLSLLHCKRRNNTDDSADEGTSHDESPTKVDVKKEIVEDTRCRVCLKDGNIPIFGNNVSEDISQAVNTIGGIEVSVDDAYPKFLCQSCNSLLCSAIQFRKTAQQSDLTLREPPLEIIDDDEPHDDVGETLYVHKPKKVERKKHHCKKCEMTFPSFKEYSEHRMSEEHENMRLTCPICHNSYAALYYKKHMAIHQGRAPYMCDICGKNFIMQGQFTRHRLTHFYKLPFKCSICPYKGRFKESLKMHMRSHTGEKPYQCTQCPSRFINKSNLNKHMLTHKGEHDFRCDSCGRGFYTNRELEMHYKVDHTGIKDHVCNICGKAFGYRKQMMKHQLKVHKRAKLRSGRMPLYLKVETMNQQGRDISIET